MSVDTRVNSARWRDSLLRENQVRVHLHIHFKLALLHVNLCFSGFSFESVIIAGRILHLINELNKYFNSRSFYICKRLMIVLLKNYPLLV